MCQKVQDRAAISGNIKKTFHDIEGWLDITKKVKRNQKMFTFPPLATDVKEFYAILWLHKQSRNIHPL